jgi:hypothetical protein
MRPIRGNVRGLLLLLLLLLLFFFFIGYNTVFSSKQWRGGKGGGPEVQSATTWWWLFWETIEERKEGVGKGKKVRGRGRRRREEREQNQVGVAGGPVGVEHGCLGSRGLEAKGERKKKASIFNISARGPFFILLSCFSPPHLPLISPFLSPQGVGVEFDGLLKVFPGKVLVPLVLALLGAGVALLKMRKEGKREH